MIHLSLKEIFVGHSKKTSAGRRLTEGYGGEKALKRKVGVPETSYKRLKVGKIKESCSG